MGYDLTYKTDLVEKLPAPPELVMLGGSRAQRFERSHIERVTGLSALNFAVQNCRPEDAYAISRYLIERAPGVKLQCFFAVQATTFGEIPMHPGLLYDPRLVRWFPDALVAEQKEANEPLEVRRVPSSNRFSSRGRLLYNFYDKRLDAEGPRSAQCASTSTAWCPRPAPRRRSASAVRGLTSGSRWRSSTTAGSRRRSSSCPTTRTR
ncbi:MAG TPA: hypothetical protein VIL79_03245 [Thermoleophilia bacterium]